MKKFLYVSAFLPQLNAPHAGGRVAHENLDRLNKAGVVDVVVCTTEIRLPSTAESERFVVVRHSTTGFLRYLLTHIGSLSLRTMVSAPVIHTRLNVAAESEIRRLIAANDYDEVFVDFTQILLLAKRATIGTGKRPDVVLCVHDVFVQRMLRSSRLLDIALAGCVGREEQDILGSVDGVIVLSQKDRQLTESLYAIANVQVKPFLPPAWCAYVDRTHGQVDPASMVFFGNFERLENSSAARWFVGDVLSRIRVSVPSASLTLIGTGSDRLAAGVGVAGVFGTGFVDNPAPIFSRCACAIAPLFQGAGVKFKVLEALASGVPVVGTVVACEGIDPQPGLIVASAEDFALQVIEVLKSASGDASCAVTKKPEPAPID